MAENDSKILAWQIVISIVVGIILGYLMGFGEAEKGFFFFDLPFGILWGLVGGLVVIFALAAVLWIVMALVGSGFSGALASLGAFGPVRGYNAAIGRLKRSSLAWALAWGAGCGLGWAVIAALIWSTGVGSNVGVSLLLLIGVLIPVVLNLVYGVTKPLSESVTGGYGWVASIVKGFGKAWTAVKLPAGDMKFAAGATFGLTGLAAFLTVDWELGVFGFLFMVFGGFLGMMIGALIEAS
jgi:hypothetical protein